MKKYLCEACGYIYDRKTGYVHCADLEKTHLLKQNNA